MQRKLLDSRRTAIIRSEYLEIFAGPDLAWCFLLRILDGPEERVHWKAFGRFKHFCRRGGTWDGLVGMVWVIWGIRSFTLVR